MSNKLKLFKIIGIGIFIFIIIEMDVSRVIKIWHEVDVYFLALGMFSMVV